MTPTRHISSLALWLLVLALPTTAQVSIAPSSLTFQPQLVNTSSPAETVTLTNAGKSQLTITTVTASAGYSVSNNNCASVSPASSCTVEVKFISELLGTTKGVLTFSDNDHSSPQVASLSGTTVPPLTFFPSIVNFGAVTLGTTSAPQTIKLTRNGEAFNPDLITTSGNFVQANNCPPSLPATQSCIITVFFRPTSRGSISGALSVSSSSAGSGLSAVLTGTGTGPVTSQVSLQPASLNFGRVGALDFSNHEKTITLTNLSATTSLTFQGVSITGPTSSGSAEYQVAANTCKGMLAPGARCRISVALGDSLLFPISAPAALTIFDSDVTSPQVIGLSATMLPEVSFSPAQLAFAPQSVGTTSASQIVTLTNNLDLSAVSLLPLSVAGDFVVDGTTGSSPCGFSPSLGHRQSCTIGVSFTPNRIGPTSGTISFTLYPECDPERVLLRHEACPAAQSITLKGTGQ